MSPKFFECQLPHLSKEYDDSNNNDNNNNSDNKNTLFTGL